MMRFVVRTTALLAIVAFSSSHAVAEDRRGRGRGDARRAPAAQDAEVSGPGVEAGAGPRAQSVRDPQWADARGRYAVERDRFARRPGDRPVVVDRRDRRDVRVYAPRIYAPNFYVARPYRPAYRYRPRGLVPVVPYARPYFAFRPRIDIGFGVFLGYPVVYPYHLGYPRYVYGAPYRYATPYPVGGYYASAQPAQPSVAVPAPVATYGGISFDIAPSDAEVFVDGTYVGRAFDFSPSYQPLTLAPGLHRIELEAPGREPLAFDVDVIAGQVLPYQGELRRY